MDGVYDHNKPPMPHAEGCGVEMLDFSVSPPIWHPPLENWRCKLWVSESFEAGTPENLALEKGYTDNQCSHRTAYCRLQVRTLGLQLKVRFQV